MSEQITMDDLNGFSGGEAAADDGGAAEPDVKDSPEESGEESSSDQDAKESADADNPDEGEGDDDDASDDEEGKALEYEAKDFSLPEGMELDSEMMDGALELFQEAKLTKDQAQKFVSLYAEKQQGALDRQLEQWEDVRSGWRDEAKADKEFGGKKYEENKSVMLRALNKYGSKDLVQFGNQYGWADHPAYQRFLYHVGKAVSEDQTKDGKGGGEKVPIEKRWYGEGSEAE